jgi:hypothetical protein
MNKVPFLTAVALVVGTSAAFAADTEVLKPDFATTENCAYLDQHIKTAPSYSATRHCGIDKRRTATSAADTELLSPDFATTESCVKQHIKTAPSYSATRQIAESYCHR